MRSWSGKQFGVAILSLLLLLTQSGFAQDLSATVRVKYSSGDTELDTLQEGVKYFTNYSWGLQNIPPELLGLTFTRRPGGKPINVKINAPAGTTVYLLVDSDSGPNKRAELNERLASSGWTRLADAEFVARDVKHCPIAVYKQDFSAKRDFSVKGASWSGFVVAAQNLALSYNDPKIDKTPDNSPDNSPKVSTAHSRSSLDDNQDAGPTTQISKLQTSIEALYVIEQPTGGMLGLASRFILTATPGPSRNGGHVPVSFATPVGHEMAMVLDDVARAINVHYHLDGVEKIELSFEDKYSAKDGGSIGAAIGTLMLSMIEGFDIDPNVAITGDVTADAKVGRIGGVAAKLRGAAEAGCTVVAVPADNYDQVKDALVYEGPGILTNAQIIGISNLDEAAAVCRSDRGSDLAQAIELFGQIQKSVKDSPDYLYRPEALEKLQQVVALAPNHFSARLLMLVSQRNLPRLSAAASEYYTFVAVREYLGAPAMQQTSAVLTDEAAEEALGKLNKLRPLGDLTVRPYIDAWIDDIQAWKDLHHGTVTAQYVTEKNQQVLNEETKLDTNRDLAEKMLREGI